MSTETVLAARRTAVVVGVHGAMWSGKDTVAALLKRRFARFVVRRFATPLRDALEVLTAGALLARDTETAAHKAAQLPAAALGADARETAERVRSALQYATHAGCGGAEPSLHKHLGLAEDELGRRLAEGAAVLRRAMPMTVGRLLQVFGTDVARVLFSPLIWVNEFDRRWRAEGCPDMLVPDVRFPEELALLQTHRALLYWVDADERLHGAAGGASRAVAADGRAVAHGSESALEKQRGLFARVPNNGTLAALEAHVRDALVPAVAAALAGASAAPALCAGPRPDAAGAAASRA